MKRIAFVFVMFMPVFFSEVYADTNSLSHLTVKDGLPNSTVYSAIQDSKGFMWFCTETGVSRYDGRKFENFTISDGLADNEIFKCYEDSKHRVWFLSYNGGLSYYEDGKIHNRDNTPNLCYAANGGYLLQCAEDKLHNVWFSTSLNHILKITDTGVEKCKPVFCEVYQGDFSIASALFNENGSTVKFVADTPGQYYYIQDLTRKAIYMNRSFRQTYGNKAVNRESCNGKSRLFLNGKDIVCYDGTQLFAYDLHAYGVKSGVLSFLKEDNFLWFATDEDGVFRIDLATGKPDMRMLHGELVTKIVRDNEMNVWFVTYNNGVFILKHNSRLFSNINTGTTFSVAHVQCNSGNYTISGNNSGTIYVAVDGEVRHTFRLSGRKFNRVLDIIPVGGCSVLIGCDGGLFGYDVNTKCGTDVPRYLPSYKNYGIARDSSIWICSQDNVSIFKNNKLTAVGMRPLPAKFTAIVPVSDSLYYLGSTNKLYKVSRYGQHVDTVLDDNILKTQVTGLKIANGLLWVATHGNGLFVLKNNKVTRHISKSADGLISDICEKLYDDRQGYMWVATNNGISVFSTKDLSLVSNINSDVGIVSGDIKNVTVDQGIVYAATAVGTSIFRFADVRFQSAPPSVYVTGYKKGNDQVTDPLSRFEFNYFKGVITVSFTAITFQSAQNMLYEYKFEEETEWHRTPVTDIRLFSLNPGTHALMFRAKKYNSSWSTPLLVSIIVNPLWYQTIIFKTILGIIILLVGYYFVQLRLKAIRKKAKEEHEYHQRITELESKALVSQMNPHFIFNSLNTVQQLILIKDEEQSLNFLSDFSMLMRKMLENSRKQFITLTEEIDFLRRYLQLEAIRFNNRFEYCITIDEDLPQDEIKIPPVLLQPLLENAIKHGISPNELSGSIRLSICRENEFLLATVEDNGVGIYTHKQADSRKESTALKVLQERLMLIKNGRGEGSLMRIVDKGGGNTAIHGTLIELRIPILT